MRDLTVGIFYHLDITDKTDVDKRVKYTERILEVTAPNKCRAILLVCKETTERYTIYQWTFREAKDINMEDFWAWI